MQYLAYVLSRQKQSKDDRSNVRLLILHGKTCGKIRHLTLADHLWIFLSRKT